ncbi:MAG: cell division protein FtsQ/DivIB [Alkalilacustris sp.]
MTFEAAAARQTEPQPAVAPEAEAWGVSPVGQHWDTDALEAPGGWQDPETGLHPWEMPPAFDHDGALTADPLSPARISILTDLPEEGASDLRSFVRPPAGAEAAGGPDSQPVAAPRNRWRLGRAARLGVPRPRTAPRDPAPSRIAYRLNRLWLTPMVRVVVRVGLPAWALAMTVGMIAADPDRRAWVGAQWEGLRDGIAARPEFQITGMTVTGASAPVEAALRAMLPQTWPVGSFGLDLPALRAEIETLDAVARAELRIGADRLLAVEVIERKPAAIWRNDDGLVLLDAEGHRVARLLARSARADLPLLAGAGAERAVPEALALIAAAAPLRGDLVGLMRMGERRWDVVLGDDRRILLPETGAQAALERVLAQDAAQELLSRDVVKVDMRLPQRPTVRMSEAAAEEMRRTRTATPQGGAMR